MTHCHVFFVSGVSGTGKSTLSQHLAQRFDMPFNGDAMLESQFAALELPSKESAFIIDVAQSFEHVSKQAEDFIRPLISE